MQARPRPRQLSIADACGVGEAASHFLGLSGAEVADDRLADFQAQLPLGASRPAGAAGHPEALCSM